MYGDGNSMCFFESRLIQNYTHITTNTSTHTTRRTHKHKDEEKTTQTNTNTNTQNKHKHKHTQTQTQTPHTHVTRANTNLPTQRNAHKAFLLAKNKQVRVHTSDSCL